MQVLKVGPARVLSEVAGSLQHSSVNYRTVPAGETSRPVGLTTALARYLSRFDSRVIALAVALMLLVFCLVLSFDASVLAWASKE